MIRQATIDDANEIARIHVQTWQCAYAGIVPEAHLQAMSIEAKAAEWRERLADPAATTIVALDNGDIIGWIFFGKSRDKSMEDAGEIYAFYVQQDRQRKGFGQKLLEAAETALWQEQPGPILLWTIEENTPARTFYAKEGYRYDGARKNITIAGKEIPGVRYVKLSP